MDIQVTKTKLGRVIKPADSFEPRVYAKGEFVAVEIGGKYYSRDFDATFDLAPQDTFPMQPGDNGTTALAFDVPLNVAVDAVTQGEIVVRDSSDDTVDFSTHLYAIRLAEPTAEGGQGTASSPTPAPAPGVKPSRSLGSNEPTSGRSVVAQPR